MRAESKTKQMHWVSHLGSCASFLCVIHCFGTGVLSLFAPAILPYLTHNTAVELSIWIFAATAALFTFARTQVKVSAWLPLLFIITLGSYFFILHLHKAASLALASLAIYQLLVLILYHFKPTGELPHCCHSDHDNSLQS